MRCRPRTPAALGSGTIYLQFARCATFRAIALLKRADARLLLYNAAKEGVHWRVPQSRW